MKIYTDPSHYAPQFRSELVDILRPFITSMPDEEKGRTYGNWIHDVSITKNIASADVSVLPMAWNYYYKTKQIPMALHFIHLAKEHHQDVLTTITGDEGVTALDKDVYIFRASGCQSKRLPHQYATPSFI